MRPPAEGPTHQPAVARVAPGRFARVGRFELARVRPGAPISHSPTARLGFWSAVLAASASLVFLVASGPVLLGAVAPPWDNILTLVPSLVLAPALLVLLVCVHHTARSDRKVWSHLAVAFAGVYTREECVLLGQLLSQSDEGRDRGFRVEQLAVPHHRIHRQHARAEGTIRQSERI